MLSWLQIAFDLDSNKTDVTLALSAVSFDQIYGAKSTTRGGRELWAQSVFLTHFIQINPAWHQTAWHQTIMTCMKFHSCRCSTFTGNCQNRGHRLKTHLYPLLSPVWLCIHGLAPCNIGLHLQPQFKLVKSDLATKKQQCLGISACWKKKLRLSSSAEDWG